MMFLPKSSSHLPKSSANCHFRSAATLIATLLATGGLGLSAQSAIAQTPSDISHDSASGQVQIDNNAFDLRTGAFDNSSFIPLPTMLPVETSEGVAQPVTFDQWAPNSIEITADGDYIDQAFDGALGQEDLSYRLETDSLQLTTQFDLNHLPGNHRYGEGIQVTVFDPTGEVKSRESVFVRGDGVRVGPNGETLPERAELEVAYGAADTVELRVLNLRSNGAAPSESGIYFSQDGQFIVEDLQNGGDLDFNDGQYVEIPGGQGEAIALEERNSLSYETQVVETPLAPEVRQEERVETELSEDVIQSDTVSIEEKIRGTVETPDAIATRLGHARGLRTANGEQLVYNRYAAASQIRAGSDGLGVTGQLSPLVDNPAAPPTLLSGNLAFNPTAGNNEAGLTASLSLTQFLHSTHRQATDLFGNAIENPDPNGPRLIEPGGVFTNRRWVGYVSPTPATTMLGSQIFSANGVFTLPENQAVIIEPADPQQVGRGDAAYTDNVGGLLIESTAGDISFVPQWTGNGYAQTQITLAPGEAQRIIYALVPQQPGQALQIGQRYAVSSTASGYKITDGGFTVIAADQQPQNFVQEQAEVYAVEDTLAGNNAATSLFNGIQGVYAEAVGSDRIPTIDVSLADAADARVGNALFPQEIVAGDQGQQAYVQTTRAGGFYLGAALTGGIGNQQDSIRRTTATIEQAADELRTRRTVDTFLTPLVQQAIVSVQTTETAKNSGTAFFDINSQGELTDVSFLPGDDLPTVVTQQEVDRASRLQRGEEQLVSSVTEESVELLNVSVLGMDQTTTTETGKSQPNFSPIQGELALGGVLNFGNTPWTAAANTVRAELFVRDTVFGRGSGTETGVRAEAVFHPFGEVRRDAYQYDAAGNAVAVYQTMPVVDATGQQQIETVTGADGTTVEVPVNQFVIGEAGDRLAQQVGTGRAQGPGIYLRLEDVLSDGESLIVAGGIQFSF